MSLWPGGLRATSPTSAPGSAAGRRVVLAGMLLLEAQAGQEAAADRLIARRPATCGARPAVGPALLQQPRPERPLSDSRWIPCISCPARHVPSPLGAPEERTAGRGSRPRGGIRLPARAGTSRAGAREPSRAASLGESSKPPSAAYSASRRIGRSNERRWPKERSRALVKCAVKSCWPWHA